MFTRAVFTGCYILFLLAMCIFKNDKEQVLGEDECIRDETFILTNRINEFFVDNPHWRNFLII